ncbi:UvrB/UvrC motif-containing protein [Proteiniclasticum sp. SCR006]|uniref:UvrB/UvrC motif-containing protein n=1 Tax=Proteiniclasticum aestuarii TaxID=2817862 RepID=A0A939KGV6_9CLOT|nr:UvrB/UvrC motif-containing protein [Proteiniclasticum aestuarii]MBO1264824.1 UvrB/UvrC motif-containing protein [Proteiniclasticum aestuarii]
MDSFFGSLFDMVENSNKEIDRCPKCKISFGDFQRSGLLGCSYCYEHFSKSLNPTIKRVQGGLTHTGKIPKSASQEVVSKRKIDELKLRLKDLITEEKFEEAAVVRDEIQELRKSLEEGESDAE